MCVRKLVCPISLGSFDLELCFANKRATSLPGDSETEYIIAWPFAWEGRTSYLCTYLVSPDVDKGFLLLKRYFCLLYQIQKIKWCRITQELIPKPQKAKVVSRNSTPQRENPATYASKIKVGRFVIMKGFSLKIASSHSSFHRGLALEFSLSDWGTCSTLLMKEEVNDI